VALVRERTTPTERPPLVGEDSASFHVVSSEDPYGRIICFIDRNNKINNNNNNNNNNKAQSVYRRTMGYELDDPGCNTGPIRLFSSSQGPD
jgi:hypothetical protein